MTIEVNVELDRVSAERWKDMLRARPAQIARAQYRAVKKTTQWGGVRMARLLAKENNMPVSVFKGGAKNKDGKRVRSKILSDQSKAREKGDRYFYGSKWATKRFSETRGLYNAYGTSEEVKGRLWIGLDPVKAKYLGKARKTKRGVRVGRRFYQGHPGEVAVREYPGRLPAVLYKNSRHRWEFIKEPVWGTSVKSIQSQIPGRLRSVWAQELNYEINVKGRGR